MLCKKELKFLEKCPFEELYVKNNKELLLDDKQHCLFHSDNLIWKRENKFAKELELYIQLANQDNDLEQIVFSGCIFIGNSNTVEGVLKIQEFIFLKQLDFSYTNFFTDMIKFKDNTFRRGVYMHGMEANGLTFFQNVLEGGMQISGSKFTNDFIFRKNKVKKSVSFLNSEIIGEAIFQGNEFNGKLSFRRTFFKVKRYEQKEIEPIYLPVHFDNSKINAGFKFHECDFEIGLKMEDCELNGTCEFIEVDFSFHRRTEFQNILVTDVLNFAGTTERKLFNYNVSMDLDIRGRVYFENANLIFLDEKSLAAVLIHEKQERVRIGQGCLKYKFQTKPKTLYLNEDLQSIVVELVQTFTVFFINHNGKNLGFEILHRDKEKIVFFYFSDQRDISQKQFEAYLEKTEQDLWTFIKHPEINSKTLIKEAHFEKNKSVQLKNRADLRFIDQFLYAKDALVNTMSTFFKIGARIQQDKCNEPELGNILNAIHFSQAELLLDEKMVYQVIVHNYNGTQLINVNKNNQIEVKGNENIIVQGNEKSNVKIVK